MRATQSSPIVAGECQRLPPLVFGNFAFDPQSRLLSREGEEVPLPPRVLGVLEHLLQRAGDVVSRQELIDTVWKDAFVTDTSLAEAVSALRQVLGDDPQSPTYIQTLHRRGYRFVAPVSAGNTKRDIESLAEIETPATVPPVAPSIGRQLVPWSAAVFCLLVAIAAVWQLTRRSQVLTTPDARFEIAAAAGTRFDEAAPALALSPDGTQIAWSGCDATGCRLYLRPLDRLDPSPLAGTDNGHAPFFSPDGTWIGFFADGRLKKVALAGGASITIADAATALGGVWIDRKIVYAGSPSGGLMMVSADGGESSRLTTVRESEGEVRHAWPSLVPNHRVLLFTIDTTADVDAPGLISMIGALSLDAARGSLGGDSQSPRWRTLIAGGGLARAAAPDTIVFARGSELHAIAFDPVRLATAGAPRAVLSSVATARGHAHYALSTTGSLLYAMPTRSTSADPALFWASGTRNTAEEIRQFRSARLALDGTRLAGVNTEGARADIWVADVQRGAAARLTHSGINTSPVWSAEGRIIYFASRTDGVFEIWSRDADGTRPATRHYGAPRHAFPLSVSPDGTMLAFLQTADATRADIWGLPLGGGTPRPLVQSPFDENAASFSPDSKLLAFQSAETGTWQIYVLRIRDGRRIVVSTDGGERPVWTRGGLYYQSRGRLMRASISQDNNAGDLRVEHFAALAELQGGTLEDVASDGRALLHRGADLPSSSAVLSLEWLRDIRALLGPPASALPR